MQSKAKRFKRVPIVRTALLSSLGILACLTGSAGADTFTWTQNLGGDASGSWNTGANWNAGAGPVAAGEDNLAAFDTLDVSASSTIALDADQTIGGLIFGDTDTGSAGSWMLSAGTPAGTLALSTSSGSPTITVNSSVSDGATISAGLTGTDGLTKAGAGTLVLSGSNNGLSGGIIVSAGTLNVGSTDALGGNGIQLAGGNLSFLNATNNYGNNLTVTSNTQLSGTNNNYTVTLGSLTIGSQLVVLSTSNGSNPGFVFSGQATLTGNATFGIHIGSSSKAMTTNTILLAGGMTVDAASVSANSTTTATFRVDTSGVSRTRRFQVNGVISDAAPDKKLGLTLAAGAGFYKVIPTLTLTGANTYTGLTTVSIGTLLLDNGGSLATSHIRLNGGNSFTPTGSQYAGGMLAGGTTGNGGTVNYLIDGDASQAIEITQFGLLDLTNLKLAVWANDPTLTEYVIADKAVGSPNVIGEAFASVSVVGAPEWSISYTGTDLHPNSIVLSVPEPGGMAVIGLALTGLLRRRRRQ